MQVQRSVVRYRYVTATLVFVLVGLLGNHDEGDLEFFDIARHVLLSGHGLQLYAQHPNIQIGPLAVVGVMAANATFLGQLYVAAVVAGAVLLLLTLRSAELLATEAGATPRQAHRTIAVGGIPVAVAWAVAVPGWGHLDDLAALLALTGALRAARGGRALSAGLLVAAGVDCKPWAAFAWGLLLVLPGAASRCRAAAAAACGVAVCWTPFLIAAPQTLGKLGRFQIPASPESVPGLFGAAEAPPWVRLAQLLLASAVVVGCVKAGRWELALLLVAVSRLALDGGAYPYYDVELVVACLVADVVRSGHGTSRIATFAPLTCTSFVGMEVVRHLSVSAAAVLVRLTLYGLLLTAAWFSSRPKPSPTSTPAREPAVPVAVA